MRNSDTELLTALQQAIESTGWLKLNHLSSEVSHGAYRLDHLFSLSTPEGNKSIALEVLRSAYPRDIRNAAWQLEGYRLSQTKAADIIPMVAAEHLSAGAREELREHGIAYFDSDGSLFLKQKPWLIDIQRPKKTKKRTQTVPLFTGAREQVIHTLLYSRGQFLSGAELAELSKTSTYTVSIVLNELDKQEQIESEGSGRTLRRRIRYPDTLLDRWAEVWSKRREAKTKWYFYGSSSDAMLEQFSAKTAAAGWHSWIVTGETAGNAIAKHLTRTDVVDIIIPPGATQDFSQLLDLQPVDKGANVTLVERDGTSDLFTVPYGMQNCRLASPIILYLDLLNGKGRNKELAAQLRSDTLKL